MKVSRELKSVIRSRIGALREQREKEFIEGLRKEYAKELVRLEVLAKKMDAAKSEYGQEYDAVCVKIRKTHPESERHQWEKPLIDRGSGINPRGFDVPDFIRNGVEDEVIARVEYSDGADAMVVIDKILKEMFGRAVVKGGSVKTAL